MSLNKITLTINFNRERFSRKIWEIEHMQYEYKTGKYICLEILVQNAKYKRQIIPPTDEEILSKLECCDIDKYRILNKIKIEISRNYFKWFYLTKMKKDKDTKLRNNLKSRMKIIRKKYKLTKSAKVSV